MHIGDFSTGNLGANAIVGGSVPIATGAAMAIRYERADRVVCCFAGDGAYANGVVLESLNWAAQDQWTNHLAGDRAHGLPIIYLIQNNHYGMTHRTDDEVMGVRHLARRAAGFADDNMHAEVVNGMDVLAVRDAVRRAAALCRAGEGPVLIEASTYRYYGHSLSDPRNEYRTREEEAAWRAVDPIDRLERQLVETGVADAAGVAEVEARVRDRNARAAVRASKATDPDPADVLAYLYTDTTADEIPDGAPAVVDLCRAPGRQARRERRDQLQGRPPRGARRGDVPRRAGHPLRRGRRRLRRRLQADQGAPRGLRPRARLQHPDHARPPSAEPRWGRRSSASGRSSS